VLVPRERELVLRERGAVLRGFAVRPELVPSPEPALAEELRPLDPELDDFARVDVDLPPAALLLEEARDAAPLDRDEAARDPEELERVPPPLLRDDVPEEEPPDELELPLEPSSAVHLPDMTR